MNNINKLKILIVALTSVLQFANFTGSKLRKGIVRNNAYEIPVSYNSENKKDFIDTGFKI
ncbi:hypothetical protein [Flavobacterium sp. N1736]|uniref:hypothetical protein n=1 Tax=Flavobacterium sp. N1736 TaxID=2986823 RepID=UPI0022253345|nr:hypothetical protein [Flavobacterium sp. N1736]